MSLSKETANENTVSGFTKTRIPLVKYFDSSPVSRFQAKRLVSRLDRFRQVELDFSGLDWIRQGIAQPAIRGVSK